MEHVSICANCCVLLPQLADSCKQRYSKCPDPQPLAFNEGVSWTFSFFPKEDKKSEDSLVQEELKWSSSVFLSRQRSHKSFSQAGKVQFHTLIRQLLMIKINERMNEVATFSVR